MKIQLNSFEFMEIAIENSLKKKQVHCWKEKTMKIIAFIKYKIDHISLKSNKKIVQ